MLVCIVILNHADFSVSKLEEYSAGLTSGSPLLGAGSNCRKLFLICSSTSMMAAMLPAQM